MLCIPAVGDLLVVSNKYSVPELYRDGSRPVFIVVEVNRSPNPRRPEDTHVILYSDGRSTKYTINTCLEIMERLNLA